MIDFSKIKLAGGISTERERFSPAARRVFDVAVNHRRQGLMMHERTLRGTRFNDDAAVYARLESMFNEGDFMACPGARIDAALMDAASADYWYQYEVSYDDDIEQETESAETEIAGGDDDE